MKWLNYKKLSILRVGLTAALILFLAPSFLSAPISHQEFEAAVTDTLAGTDASVYPRRDEQVIRRCLGLNPSDFKNIAFMRSDDNMAAEEMAIVQFDTPAQKNAFVESCHSRIQKQRSVFDGYAPEQTALMDKAVVKVWGNYGIYVVGSQADQIVSALNGRIQV